MSAVATSPTPFSGDELIRLLAPLEEADSVELKVTVPESHQRSAVTALGMDPLEGQLRQAVFFDTPDLTLDEHGVVVRARRVQGRGGDSAVKLRPVVPGELPPKLRRSAAFRVEVDALPGGFVCSGSLKGTLRADEAKAGLAGEVPRASSSPRSSASSSPRTPPRASRSTTSRCSGRSSC